MHVHIASARVAEDVQSPPLRVVVAQTDPKDQTSLSELLRDVVDMPSDHGAGEESAQPGADHAAHNAAGDCAHCCRAKTDGAHS